MSRQTSENNRSDSRRAAAPKNAAESSTPHGGSASTLSAEIDRLLNEQRKRESGRSPNLKMRVWRFIVRATYAVKRFFDLALTISAMIVLSVLYIKFCKNRKVMVY